MVLNCNLNLNTVIVQSGLIGQVVGELLPYPTLPLMQQTEPCMCILLCRSNINKGAKSTPVLASVTAVHANEGAMESQQLADNLPGVLVLDNNCAVPNQ